MSSDLEYHCSEGSLFVSVFMYLQLRDPKNDFIFNFNFDDEMKNL